MAAANRQYPVIARCDRWMIVAVTNDDIYHGWALCYKASTSPSYVEEASDTANSRFAGFMFTDCVRNAAGTAGLVHGRIISQGIGIIDGGSTLAGIPTGVGDVAYALTGDTMSHSGNNKAGFVVDMAISAIAGDPFQRANAVAVLFGYESLV